MVYQSGANDLLRSARLARLSPSGSGRPMSRQDLAEAVAAYVFEHEGRACSVDAKYVGRLERGEHRWPSAHYRTAFRAVLGAASDAQLGLFVIRGEGSDMPGREADLNGQDVGVAFTVPAASVGAGVLADRDAAAGSVFGVRLKQLRVGCGLSLRRLGRLVHYSHGYLWDLEAGAKRPTVEAASALDRALDADGALLALVADAVAAGDAAPDVPGQAWAGAVAVWVNAAPGASVTVVCDEGGSGRVAVVAGGMRVLIDTSGGDAASPGRTVVGAPAAAMGGARVYSLARRRAARP